jgi:hypothetical protein
MKRLFININNSELCLLHSQPNGDLLEHDNDSYWKIGDVLLEVKSKSNRVDILFTLVEGSTKSSTYEIHNILYNKVDLLNKKLQKETCFNINEYDIKIRVITDIPSSIYDIDVLKNIESCKSKRRDIKINKLL